MNASKFELVLQSLVHYSKDSSNPTGQKMALSVMGKMIIAWGGGIDSMLTKGGKEIPKKKGSTTKGASVVTPPSEEKVRMPEFESYAYNVIIPLLFEIPQNIENLAELDGPSMMILNEIGFIHRVMFVGHGQLYKDYLSNVLFPRLFNGVVEEGIVDKFIAGLNVADGGRGVRKSLQAFFKMLSSK